LGSDDESANLVTNWMLESNLSSEQFEDYHQAISMFNNISKNGTQVILYEIKKSPVDGSIVKKTPLLNSKKVKTKSRSFKTITTKSGDKSDDHPKNKNKFKDSKVRIFLLVIVILTFIVIMFFMNSIAGESSNVITVHQSILFRIDNPSYFLHL
jgi:hypothetical protein